MPLETTNEASSDNASQSGFSNFVTYIETDGRSVSIAILVATLAGSVWNLARVAPPEVLENAVKIGSTIIFFAAIVYLLCKAATLDCQNMTPKEGEQISEDTARKKPSMLRTIIVYDILAIASGFSIFGWCIATFLAWNPIDGIHMTSPNVVSLSVLGVLASSAFLIGSLFGFRVRNGNDTFGAAVTNLLVLPGMLMGGWFIANTTNNLSSPFTFSHWSPI